MPCSGIISAAKIGKHQRVNENARCLLFCQKKKKKKPHVEIITDKTAQDTAQETLTFISPVRCRSDRALVEAGGSAKSLGG